ncbi:hypothetical protein [Chryseobacterium sp.]|uniref:hypothetical protein n=1 Tax=Chryseobacterium sp. TaxID=1871047 RepID=UPI0011C8F513|nr:hypothetical protein [Chryseobacterium sp.]TXF74881.1 hypothetical protein FUA25_11365 [Chryseobacterium sp.]
MKTMKPFFAPAIFFAFLSCASTQDLTTNDGSSMEKAIRVASVAKEYEIVREKCGGCKMKSQSLTFDDKKQPFDILTLVKPNGEEVKYYFNISKFYGRF